MNFKIIGEITDVESIATGSGIRELGRLNKFYGKGSWRKLKGAAKVKFSDGASAKAEAHGIGRKEFKIKHYLD